MNALLRVVRLCALLAPTLATAACVVTVDAGRYAAREEKVFHVTGTPDLTLITFDGSVEVRSWDKPEIRVEIEKHAPDKALAEKIEIAVEQSGNRVTVEAKKPAAVQSLFGLRVSPSARIVATVPRQCNLVARTGDGAMSVERIDGKVEMNSGDGTLMAREVNGTLRAHTGDGTIRLQDLDGSVEVDTGDGGGEVSGKLSVLRLRTGDGSVNVRVEDGSAMADGWEIRTGDGGIRLELPGGFAADLDASTGDGHVSVEGFGEAGGGQGDEARGELRRQLGSGGKVLRVRSGSGGIWVKKL